LAYRRVVVSLLRSFDLYLARYEELSGRPFSTRRLSVLEDEGLVEQIGNSRLRATPTGMIVLDAVVADLAR